MSITVQQQGQGPRQGQRVAILGRLDTVDEQDALRALLHDAPADGKGSDPLELNFYDADVLPASVITALAERLDRGGSLKIVAYHAQLAHSLMRLDLPVRQVSSTAQQRTLPPLRALALAGSAQSLDKIIHIVRHLPVSGAVVFIAQHVLADQPNLLDQLLKTQTDYRVLMPQHLLPVQTGTMYIAPPGYHMKVANGLIYLTGDRMIQYARPSIDVLFESLAAEYGDAVLAALLCGFGEDGTAGCAALRRAGACVMVEDGEECTPARVMPDAARNAGHFDHILKFPAIASVAAAAVAEVAAVAASTDDAAAGPSGPMLELFLEALVSQYGYDFRGYQRDSLQRRIRNLMIHFGLGHFGDFQRAVLTDAALLERLCAELSVGVTQFFRHPEQFRLLRDKILPYLASFPMIKLWSAGCSTGEEAYSLAIVLDELGLLERSQLFATDINHYLLELARSGLFPAGPLATNRDNYLASGGPRLFDAYVVPGGRFLTLDERLRQHVLLHRHSLADTGVFNEFQLIVCRNVLIYFNADLQRQVLQRFAQSLHVDGFLLLGPQDGLGRLAEELGFVPYPSGSSIYRHRKGGQHD